MTDGHGDAEYGMRNVISIFLLQCRIVAREIDESRQQFQV